MPKDEGGMYALVFDNTFAKQFSKNVTFVLLTYPTESPPQQSHHTRHIQGPPSTTSLNNNFGPRKGPLQRESTDSVQQVGNVTSETTENLGPLRTPDNGPTEGSLASDFFTGVLQKRRRKRHQGYARRFFSLDYNSSTLSYYHDRNTLALRGAIPLSLAAIGANATTRQISIDSGAEVWHLKAQNQKDFVAWKNALEVASTRISPHETPVRLEAQGRRFSAIRTSPEEEQEWTNIENLVKRVEGSRDAAMNIAKDTDPKYLPSSAYKADIDKVDSNPLSMTSSASGSPSEQSLNNGYFQEVDRKPFWKRKQSSERTMPGMFKRSVSATPTFPSAQSIPPTPKIASFVTEHPNVQSRTEHGLHDRCMSLLKELDLIVADFNTLLSHSKQRRLPMHASASAASRYSLDSQGSQEFFDAEGGNDSQLLAIPDESENEAAKSDVSSILDGEDSSSASDADNHLGRLSRRPTVIDRSSGAFPAKPKSLHPLPAQEVERRTSVPIPKVQPPSLISFLRKNVGKDLSTIAMPVSANEPLSLLQRTSEQLEYSQLLDKAASSSGSSSERLLLISAFAVSSLSSARVKDRSIRKPFNPMLGETFELVREDRGFRLLAEKVSHRPVRMACQAESAQWTFTQAPAPTQKFWGKSAELVTEGRVRIALHTSGDRFSWVPATSFLRNVIAGEKYVEPVGNLTVNNEVTGEKATVTFKSKGMFSGRIEDVAVQIYDTNGNESTLGLAGKWTSSLSITENGATRKTEPIWTVDDLVPDAAKRYGMTAFAASLNEITGNEKGKLAPTDSRLRPDQRAAEEGDLDTAEELKQKLEEAQRRRRKEMEDAGEEWQPKWFERLDDEGTEQVWRLRSSNSYWDQRGGKWEDVANLFDV